jgi:mannosyltransferase OCH1-like enzyme
MKEQQIPKVIHYVWFGRGKKSPLIKHCIKRWRKVMPDYEIIEWNEDNFDVNMNTYCRQAYEKGKYAFAADYARLWILYNHGGIYMDTDVAAFKSLEPFLSHTCFLGFEND